ncbi:hypothetical protein ABI59_21995 [Acidobacteria bacterium Mor1]|nr:hypothetical protein ABI59_21995 [Acidobacteria bacterium Mor1]
MCAVALTLLAGCELPAGDVAPAERNVTDPAALERPGFGQVSFAAEKGHPLQAWTYRSTGFDPNSGPIWFLMHGQSRNADRYARSGAWVAERHDALLVAIRFSDDWYPGSRYTTGLTRSGKADSEAAAEGRWLPPEATPYGEVERIFDAVRDAIGGQQQGYYLAGHSAGGQFTHRLLTFYPENRVLRAVAINAGWYTLPSASDGDLHQLPYGLAGAPVDEGSAGNEAVRRRLLSRGLAVLVGEKDIQNPREDSRVRGTRQAMAQGESRFERGRFYVETAREEAKRLGVDSPWSFHIAPGAGHRILETVDSAGYLLFAGQPAPCTPETDHDAARKVVIAELLADPPKGTGGDANGDGERDPADDEFVELHNTGSRPVCLEGWSLGDADDPERHVFPLGDALEPGERRVIFGGGIPTGSFGGSQVGRARGSKGFNLSNDGDVLTLRDAGGRVVQQVSWGDCDGAKCADDHWKSALDVAASLSRRADGSWALSPRSAPFTPGEPMREGE